MVKLNRPRCLCGCGGVVKRGRKYIQGHWLKCHAFSQEARNKVAITLTGKKRSQESIENQRKTITGRKQPQWVIEKRRQGLIGIPCSEEKKKKLSLALIDVKHTPERIEANRLAQIQFHKDYPEAGEEFAKRMQALRCANGLCSGNYKRKDFNYRLKELIRDRDGRQCQLCFIDEKENGKKLDVHYIDYDKENCDLRNLISLCIKCHAKTNINRNKWMLFFNGSRQLILINGGT